MKRRQLPLDHTGDDKRIVKLADIELFELTEGWIFRKRFYEARHVPTGITSGPEWYAIGRPGWATADCISKVLDHLNVPRLGLLGI